MRTPPSPAPKSPPKRWPVVLAVLVVLLVVLGGVVAAVPLVGIPYAEAQVKARLRKRLKVRVEVDDVELRWGQVVLSSVTVGGGDGEPTIALDRIEVALEESSLWSGVAEVTAVRVRGGSAEGSVASFEDLIRRMRSGRRPGAKASTGRVKLRPSEILVDDLALDVTQGARALRARIDASVDVDALRIVTAAREIHIDSGVGQEIFARNVSATVQAGRTEAGYALAFPQRLEVRGLAAPINENIAVAGVDGWVEVSDAGATEISLELAGAFGDTKTELQGEKLWSVGGRLRRDLSEGELRVDMDAFEVVRVPREVIESLPLVESDDATVGGHLAVVFGDGVAALEGDLSLEGFGVSSRTLSRQTVRDLGMDVSFAAEVDPAARRAVLHYVDVERGGVTLSGSAVVEHPERTRGRRYELSLEVPRVACQRVMDAIPDGFAPGLEGFRLGGEFGARVTAHIDFADLETLALGGLVDMDGCEVLATPIVADRDRLAGGFTHRVLMNDGGTASVQMYPGARGFASIRQISPYVTAAIRTTEDGGFWKHDGFMPSQFEVALRRNLAAGRVRLGASTITMQMVKNVLLGHERTLSRKFQEMFLTWYVEEVLSKDRIMELYLNAIEYGPGIYGIVDAASYYFGKHPADLDPPEAVFLALMLPSPVKRSVYYCNGELSERFAIKVARILRLMNERGRLSDLEYELWKEQPVVFDLRRRGSQKTCLARITRMREGTFTQMPLSGLLSSEAVLDEPPPPPRELPALDLDPADEPADGPEHGVDLEGLPGSEDPANVDDRGVPAMDR
ncbi:MAG: transglycosylase domain-containing protein [Nannocystaceae bacterium]|nr:transglycosylase domain-containing protein [bacterium]